MADGGGQDGIDIEFVTVAAAAPLRLLVVAPSWLGDVVMATPAFRWLRTRLRGSFIGTMVRPGLDELLAGSDLFDEVHVASSQGLMGPKRAAAKVRGRAYDTALLLTNSFSTALVARLAFIPRRIGYDRDGRGMLLSERLTPERKGSGFAPVPMVDYYLRAARAATGDSVSANGAAVPNPVTLELALTPGQDAAAERLLRTGGITALRPIAVINPGGNSAAKRWPADRFAIVAAHLAQRGMDIAINGSPGERELVAEVARLTRRQIEAQGQSTLAADGRATVVAELPTLDITIGSLKGVVRRSAIMITNDTGPRHIAAAFNVPSVTLFGPTDHRWTTLPADGTPRVDLLADPTLPHGEVADDHPDRCRIDRIEPAQVIDAAEMLLRRSSRAAHG
jgi:heptosyltransferase-2